MSAKLFFLTTRGLESLSANEIAELPAVTIGRIGYRRITASCAGSLAPLLNLRTVDDIFLDLASWRNVGRPRQTLALLRDLSSRLDLRAAAAKLTRLRVVPRAPAFSVTASFVGKRNYGAEEIKSAVSEGVMIRHDWRYTNDDAADLNVRVFIERETAFVGLRLGRRPLHEREYKKPIEPAHSSRPLRRRCSGWSGLRPDNRYLIPAVAPARSWLRPENSGPQSGAATATCRLFRRPARTSEPPGSPLISMRGTLALCQSPTDPLSASCLIYPGDAK